MQAYCLSFNSGSFIMNTFPQLTCPEEWQQVILVKHMFKAHLRNVDCLDIGLNNFNNINNSLSSSSTIYSLTHYNRTPNQMTVTNCITSLPQRLNGSTVVHTRSRHRSCVHKRPARCWPLRRDGQTSHQPTMWRFHRQYTRVLLIKRWCQHLHTILV